MRSENSGERNFTRPDLQMNAFRLAVIGCGKWGLNHVRTAHSLFGDGLSLCCDTDAGNYDKVAQTAPGCEFTANISDVAGRTDINSVIVATPAETHYEITKQLLLSGKNVLTEKPITLNSGEARELDSIARERGLILMVGHLLLYHPAILMIKKFIDDGKLGKLQYIYSNRLNLGTIRAEENILWSFAPHDISVIQFFADGVPDKISATGAIFVQHGIHDTTLTCLEFSKNIHAHIYVSWLHPFKEQRLVVIGDKSMIVFEDTLKDNKLKYYRKGFELVNGTPVKIDSDFENVEFDKTSPLELEQLHFAECVRTGSTPRTGGRNGVEVLETLERAQQELMKN